MTSPNYSFYALPAYYLLVLLPHAYAGSLLPRPSRDNRNPRSTTHLTSLQKSLPPALFARYERAESAHKNGMENLPVFAVALLMGHLARLEGLNLFAGGYLGLRVLYTGVYLRTETKRWSFLRSGVWGVGSVWALCVMFKAAGVLAAEGA